MQGLLLVPMVRPGVRCGVLLAGRAMGLCFAPVLPDGGQATGLKRGLLGLEVPFEAHLLHQWRAQQPQRGLPPACQAGAQTPACINVEQVISSLPPVCATHILAGRSHAVKLHLQAQSFTTQPVKSSWLCDCAVQHSCLVLPSLDRPHRCVSGHHLRPITRCRDLGLSMTSSTVLRIATAIEIVRWRGRSIATQLCLVHAHRQVALLWNWRSCALQLRVIHPCLQLTLGAVRLLGPSAALQLSVIESRLQKYTCLCETVA